MSRIKWLLIFIFLFISSAYATNIDFEKITFYLYENFTTKAIIHVNFTDITTYNISYFVLGDIENLKVYDEKGELNCKTNKEKIGTEISCYKRNDDQVNASLTFIFYLSAITPRQNYMLFSYALPVIYPTKELKVEVYLPEGTVVVNSENFETITPKPTSIGSDEKGRRFKIEWVFDGAELGKTYTFNIYYELKAMISNQSKRRIYYIFGISTLIAIIFMIIILYYYIKKQKEEKIIEVLIEDEKKVIDAIKELGEGCKQKDVVKYTGFSKAKVSRIVEELKKRNVIEVEKVGKHNKLYLKK